MWLVFGAQDASWARQDAPPTKAEQRTPAGLRVLTPGSDLTVHLTDGSKLEGVLREVRDDAIVLTLKNGGKSTIIPLRDIQRLQTKRTGLHPVSKVLIVVGATLGALFVIALTAC
jgi:sRNA-binding regulator protein Hfq